MGAINYQRIAERSLRSLLDDPKISTKNKEDFKSYLKGIDVSNARIGIICNHIKHLYHNMSDVIGTMHKRDKVNSVMKALGKELSNGYFETVKKVSKAYVRWHNDYNTPAGWKDIKSNGKSQKRDLKPEDMITWDEGHDLANSTTSIQIKAIFLIQLDGGFRPSEFLGLNYGDVQIKENFAIARVRDGKTGSRDVILFKSVPYLQRWLKTHPSKKKDSPLWIQENNNKNGITRYKYSALQKRIRTIASKIKLNKPIDYYNLRHSACYLSKLDNVNPELAARKFGHSIRYYTDTYARLSPEDDIRRYSKHYELEDKKIEEPKTVICERCNTVNEPIDPQKNSEAYCEQCQSPLTIETAQLLAAETTELKEQMAQLIAKFTKMEDLFREKGLRG